RGVEEARRGPRAWAVVERVPRRGGGGGYRREGGENTGSRKPTPHPGEEDTAGPGCLGSPRAATDILARPWRPRPSTSRRTRSIRTATTGPVRWWSTPPAPEW